MKKAIKTLTITLLIFNTFVFSGEALDTNTSAFINSRNTLSQTSKANRFYLGFGYNVTKLYNIVYDDTDYTWYDDVKENTISWIAGYTLNTYLGIESRYTHGNKNATIHIIAQEDILTQPDIYDYTYKNDFKNVAFYLKPTLPLHYVTLYSLIGYGKTTYIWDSSYAPMLKDISAKGIQCGAGGSFMLFDHIHFFIDYTVLFKSNRKIYLGEDDNAYRYTQSHTDGKLLTFGLIYAF